ncbi:MAG TPA: hypothetical protein VH764_03345 [Gemmatimonadales bacterium]|jgi:hypothetical protein
MRSLQRVGLLILSWAAGLAAYGAALAGLRGEILSLDNWLIIGSITLVAWLVSSMLLIAPVLRWLTFRRAGRRRNGVLALAGAALAIVPVWLNVGFWYGWHPRHLMVGEAGFLGLHYATSGVVLGLSLGRLASKRESRPTR